MGFRLPSGPTASVQLGGDLVVGGESAHSEVSLLATGTAMPCHGGRGAVGRVHSGGTCRLTSRSLCKMIPRPERKGPSFLQR